MRSPEIKNKVKIRALAAELKTARQRWLSHVLEHLICQESVQGDSVKSPLKVIYIVKTGKWWNSIKTEINEFDERINKLKKAGAKIGRDLWLPQWFRNPKKITITTYVAKSVRVTNRKAARRFLEKANSFAPLKGKKFVIKSYTGRNYKLGLVMESCRKHIPFSNWTVCLCKPENVPKLKKKQIATDVETDFSDAICVFKNTALYRG